MGIENVLVFSHEQDVDGLFSAAILKIAFPKSQIVLTNYGLEKMLQVKEKVTSFVNSNDPGILIMADIGINDASYSHLFNAMATSKDRGWKNIWVDHHIWEARQIKEMSSVCELVLYRADRGYETKKCTAELCMEHFIPDNKLAKKLAAIAHRTDFPDSDRFPIPPLTGLISYYNGFPKLYERLYSVILENVIRGILWTVEMQDDIIISSKLIEESQARSIEEMKVVEFGTDDKTNPLKAAIAKTEGFVNRSVLLGRIMDDYNVGLAIAYTTDGKVSIRRNMHLSAQVHNLSCNEIAKEFREGGGHEVAAGGFLKVKLEETDQVDEKANKEIVEAISNYFRKAKQNRLEKGLQK